MAPQGDGASLRTHLQRLHRSTGRLDPLLAQSFEILPAVVQPLWDAFVSLSNTREADSSGIAPVTCQELEAWQRVYRVCLSPWEADTLLAMDRALRSGAVDRKDLTQ